MYEFIWGSGVRILCNTITVIELDLKFSLFALKSVNLLLLIPVIKRMSMDGSLLALWLKL